MSLEQHNGQNQNLEKRFGIRCLHCGLPLVVSFRILAAGLLGYVVSSAFYKCWGKKKERKKNLLALGIPDGAL